MRALKLSFLLGGQPTDDDVRPQLDEIFARRPAHDLVVHVHTSPGAASDIDQVGHLVERTPTTSRCTSCTSAAG